MANACFSSDNRPGKNCKDSVRGKFQIPNGGPWVDIGNKNMKFKVTYFKYAAKITYDVIYTHKKDDIEFTCTCPDYVFNDRLETKTCCKHIQAVIDYETGTTRAGGNYENFKVEHIHRN